MGVSEAIDIADFGLIGLSVMGSNLAQNIEDHGFTVAVWNRSSEVVDNFISETSGKKFIGAADPAALVKSLKRPRKIMLMIKAGAAVDKVIETLVPLLDEGDVIIDGGNTWYEDTERREADLAAKGIKFFGVGVSGGEEGARFGPSLMPGGDKEAYESIRPVMEAIAAKTDSGACVTHVGSKGAGHFVKMVHNGIEYADMQLIAEVYDVMSRALGLSAKEMEKVFVEWNKGPLESFLIEITGKILGVEDGETKRPLVEIVLDKAGQKGTGRWTVETALKLGVSIPSIAAALDARVLSSMKDERVSASSQLAPDGLHTEKLGPEFVKRVHDALYAAKILAYAQGMHLIRVGSDENNWGVDLQETARIWKGGCIIRARLLDSIRSAYERDPALANLILDPTFKQEVLAHQGALREVVILAQSRGIPVPALAGSLAWFDAYRTADLPQNMTQAQRDAFGAHTYLRRDDIARGAVHSEWLK
ncbi:MAG: 6-phosphogluconate dehydrogenase [Planctomycetota bacterium]|jgi:6-phosphogluconate dehydrogenase